MPALAAYLITGIPGAGKTTVSRLLAQRFPLAAHIEADRLQELIVSGSLWPDQEPREEAMRQLRLRARNAALLAESFLPGADGFDEPADFANGSVSVDLVIAASFDCVANCPHSSSLNP